GPYRNGAGARTRTGTGLASVRILSPMRRPRAERPAMPGVLWDCTAVRFTAWQGFMDARAIGERSDAILRPAMPADDARCVAATRARAILFNHRDRVDLDLVLRRG